MTITQLPVVRCQVCHQTVGHGPGQASAVLTEHIRRRDRHRCGGSAPTGSTCTSCTSAGCRSPRSEKSPARWKLEELVADGLIRAYDPCRKLPRTTASRSECCERLRRRGRPGASDMGSEVATRRPLLLVGAPTTPLWLSRHAAVLVDVDVGIIRTGTPAGAWHDTRLEQLQAVKEALDLC